MLPTAEQIISRSPGITVSNGTITVLGRGKPLVYIDDIEMRSFTEIQMLKPGDIVSIEVDYNPSSRYKADVRSVIRIRTKRKRKNHTALRLFDNAAFTREVSNMAALSVNYNRGKLGSYFNYVYSHLKNRCRYQDDYTLHEDGTDLVNTNFQRPVQIYNIHSLLAGVVYDVDTSQNITLQYSAGFNNSNRFSRSQALSSDSGGTEEVNSYEKKHGEYRVHNVSAVYNKTFADKSRFLLSADYGHGKSDYLTVSEDVWTYGQADTRHESEFSTNNLLTLNSGYSFVALRNYDVDLGLRYDYIGSATEVETRHSLQGIPGNDMDNDIKDRTLAAYINIVRKIGKFGLEAGLRME